MSRGVKAYSRSKLDLSLITEILCRVSPDLISLLGMLANLSKLLINAHTLTAPAGDPIGICVDPTTAVINHSCEPNAFIVFDGRRLSLRSLIAIPEAKEITISYIDTRDDNPQRQADLLEQYFFECKCKACTSDPRSITKDQENLIERSRSRSAAIVSKVPKDFPEILDDFHPENLNRPHGNKRGTNFPLEGLLGYYIQSRQWPLGLEVASYIHEFIESAPYPQPWHPVRMTATWMLAMMMLDWPHMDGPGIAKIEDMYSKVLVGMIGEVRDNVDKTHDRGSAFSKMVYEKCEELREDFENNMMYKNSIE
jgi:hypothetical protein